MLGEAIPESHATREQMSKSQFLMYLLIPLSVGMFPHIFQHWMTARNADSFKLPVVFHPLFIMIVWVPCVLVGVWTVAVYASPELRPAGPPLPTLPSGVVDANKVLPFLVKTQTGAILGGFLAAGILAAIMSSLDSQFLCLGTIFNNDIVTHYLGKDAISDQRQVLLTRSFIVVIVAVTYVLSLGNVRSVFAMGVWCFSGFTALFPIVIAALYWRGLSAAGASCGILAAIISWCYLFYQGTQLPMDKGGLSGYMIRFRSVTSRSRSCRSSRCFSVRPWPWSSFRRSRQSRVTKFWRGFLSDSHARVGQWHPQGFDCRCVVASHLVFGRMMWGRMTTHERLRVENSL